jgi:hypothetical protein
MNHPIAHRHPGAAILLLLGFFAIIPNLLAADNKDHAKSLPPAYLPAVEQAVDSLGGEPAKAAVETLRKTAVDQALPPFARAAATWALARQALDNRDAATAAQWLEKLSGDDTYPLFQRDLARRRIREMARAGNGLPPRDPTEYRAVLPTLPTPGITYHVSAGADQRGEGTITKPFATLRQAREAAQAYKKAHAGQWPNGGVRILVGGGVYPVTESLQLTAEDSGTADAPMVYMAITGETPIFDGGVRVKDWRPLSDPKLKERLAVAARDRVMESDVSSLPVSDWGDATTLRQCPELFCDGKPQTLARWPNEGFIKTGEVLGQEKLKEGPGGCKDGKFRYLEDRPSRWTGETDARLYGYWYWDWYEEFQKVAAIDPVERTITLTPPYSNYGYRRDQRFYALNLFSEIDQPGEWYLDRNARKIYWLPPAEVELQKSQVSISVLSKPFLTLKQTSHVLIEGLVFQGNRGDAIRVEGGADCLVAGCAIRQCGGDGIVVKGGVHHGVFGVTIHTMGCGGVAIQGGDREQLIPGHHFVENCWIHNISRLKRTYTPAVLVEGCGHRVAHNLFEDMPSSALRVEGNDHLVELNRVRRVVRESDDQGGLDAFGNPMYRGLCIRWNHWVDIGGGTGCGAAGVRLDDVISGVAIYGNVFERCGAVQFGGIQIHGGKENWIDGNAFLDCFAGLSFSRWGEKRWLDFLQKYLPQARSAPYVARYPELARLRQDWDVNCVSRNVFAHCAALFLRDGGVEQCLLNCATDQPMDPAWLAKEPNLRKDPQLARTLIDPIPWEEIGPYPHAWRAANQP